MLTKFGVNSVCAKKSGPTVKKSIAKPGSRKFSRVVTCECGARLEKTCENEMVCEIAALACPKCGREVR
jgi:hypothetical protein